MLLPLALSPAPATASRHEAAARWIVEAQERDGSWGAGEMETETRAYVTSSALLSLLNYVAQNGEDAGVYSRAAEDGARWLQNREFEDVASLSAGALAMEGVYLETGDVGFREKGEVLWHFLALDRMNCFLAG